LKTIEECDKSSLKIFDFFLNELTFQMASLFFHILKISRQKHVVNDVKLKSVS
jgi:hypothetical protein